MADMHIDETPSSTARPRMRAECPSTRPCPWVSCRYHLWLDVRRNGEIHVPHPDARVHELESCALDVAERGPQTLKQIGEIFGLCCERIRQIQQRAVERVGARQPELLTLLREQ